MIWSTPDKNTLNLVVLVWTALCLIGPVIGFFGPILEESRRRGQRRHASEAEQRALQTGQHALALRLSGLMADSTKSARSLWGWLSASEVALDKAEEEFREGAFAPFWDAVEESANALARFNHTVRKLISNSDDYRIGAKSLPAPAPPFQIGLDALPDASQAAARLRVIVRRAQKDFQFASIYEQRKTNRILVEGFSSLGQAITDLGERLDLSLQALGSSIGLAISEASEAETSKLESLREQMAEDARDAREDSKLSAEMLDNIQRRRRPTPRKFRDGEY
ncbi:MAG: hypothetical protein ACREJC_10345 [Tepidisphaeraceae bacterium]